MLQFVAKVYLEQGVESMAVSVVDDVIYYLSHCYSIAWDIL